MGSKGSRTLVVVALLALLALAVPAAWAKPRTGTVTDPVERLGRGRDIVRIAASYDPANGNMRARVRFATPIVDGTLVSVWFRPSQACRASARDIRFEASTQASLPSFEVTRQRPAGFSEGVRKVSRDRRELILTFGTPMLGKLDLRCVYAETRDAAPASKKVYDTLNKPLLLR